MLQLFGLLGGILAFIGVFPYTIDILRRKAKPQRSSFFIWSALGLIVVFSQAAKGATNSLWLPSLETVGGLVIFLLSIKYGVGGFSKRDYIALLVAGLGLIGWYFTKEAAIALYLVILIDSTGVYLELHKAYTHPETETHIAWILAALGGVCALLSVGTFNIILISYPIFIILANAAVIAAIEMGYNKKKRKK